MRARSAGSSNSSAAVHDVSTSWSKLVVKTTDDCLEQITAARHPVGIRR